MAESSESCRLVDLRCRLNDAEELRRLIQALAYPPEIAEARSREILQSYRQHPEWPFVAVQSGGELVAFAGILRKTTSPGIKFLTWRWRFLSTSFFFAISISSGLSFSNVLNFFS